MGTSGKLPRAKIMKQIIYQIKRYYHWLKTGILGGLLAQIRYGFPEKKLKIIAITGTDGKTTSATLVYHLLQDAGYPVGLISTVAAYIGKEELDTGFHVTSPHPKDLYRFMRQMVKANIHYLVLEITSQGAYQFRNWGIKPLIAGLTNIDREHLDYHLTFENYLRAKMLVLNSAATAVVNEDQDTFNSIKKELNKKVKLVTYGKKTRFSAQLEKAIRTKFIQDYNRDNAYLAVTIAKEFDINEKSLTQTITNFHLPRGRMQLIPNHLDFTMIVDFAHTPQALQAALRNLRRTMDKQGKLIAIVGCAGLRDRTKRAPMGKIMAELADIAIFTAEDPRTENIWSIIRQMKEDVGDNLAKVISIPNREEALQFALNHYGGDHNTIAIFGKGHEQSMNYDGKHEILWNDIEAATTMIKKMEAAND